MPEQKSAVVHIAEMQLAVVACTSSVVGNHDTENSVVEVVVGIGMDIAVEQQARLDDVAVKEDDEEVEVEEEDNRHTLDCYYCYDIVALAAIHVGDCSH